MNIQNKDGCQKKITKVQYGHSSAHPLGLDGIVLHGRVWQECQILKYDNTSYHLMYEIVNIYANRNIIKCQENIEQIQESYQGEMAS